LSGQSGLSGASGAAPSFVDTIDFMIDGGGSVIESQRLYGWLKVPYAATITGVTLLSESQGSAEIDIWKCSYASFPANSSDSICSNDYAQIDDNYKGISPIDFSIATWDTTIGAGEILAFYVRQSSCVGKLLIHLTVSRSS
jgi:hypothetical protein